MRSIELLSSGRNRAERHLTNLKIVFNSVNVEVAAFSIESLHSQVLIVHMTMSRNQVGTLLDFEDNGVAENSLDTVVTSWVDDLTATFVGSVLPPGPLIANPSLIRIETANCIVQDRREGVIDDRFCPTLIPPSPSAIALLTPL
jgi:hypothetical protein